MTAKSKEREAAKLSGSKTYISQTPCKYCGNFKRYISSYGCVPCNITKGLEKLNNLQLMAPYKTKEKQLKSLQNWRKNNPDKVQQQRLRIEKYKANAWAAKYRGKKRKQTPANTNFQVIQSIYLKCEKLCKNTNMKYEVDHIIPISKGGLHHQDNLQILLRNENRSKGAKL